mmetsp:Transcript_8105/g.12063  ORF Transcript_8105/g.12063 Transcript_8105/m.12063 type:complete len:220 (-) Transcript_8105:184-843(-)|eukprot:CAMPEP_0116026546 /NCGR_PEP_ID=MMETSP0321-20121206/13933_1 /TAXON_ID=163516 /ORGANISM="Leptocylindrus danicus var. danicus, Strain B650" /LENGTH=219 /DNA_ID=CAMNT_0003499401 /DNA_START=39 /DNA_END=698 /DNA_ORIENTATION=+
MKVFAALLLLTSAANAEVVKLTPSNYAELTEGKTVFIKYFAPWCGHCQAMASDWEKLAEDWAGHDIGLVAEVDCTDEESEELCVEVQGFPTLKYGDPEDLEDYDGARGYDELSAFAKDTLSSAVCSLKNIDACSDEKKAQIQTYKDMSTEELAKVIEEEEQKIAVSESNLEEEIMKLQQIYEELIEAHTDLMKQVNDNGLRMMKAVEKSKGSPDVKDEL